MPARAALDGLRERCDDAFMRGTRPIRIANASAYYGDRLTAVEEMVRGGPIDVLTGDYLAELTLAILHRTRQKDPAGGYARTFLVQLERVLGECLEKGIRVVVNAGGLDPRGLARAVGELAARLGMSPRVASVDGDDLVSRIDGLLERGAELKNRETGALLRDAGRPIVTANAYLGGFGIREALQRGADIVVCGRVTDAALVVGPAAWWFDWRRDDWDPLAGAVIAGHVIECGPQATGGNYSFLHEVHRWDKLGFPLAEIDRDGSFVVTKHPGTGGLVSVGTVTAQLLYEIEGPRYLTPDVVARFDTIRVTGVGEDRVAVTGARGEAPPETSKVVLNLFAGFRNSMTVMLAEPDLEEKAHIVESTLRRSLGEPPEGGSLSSRLVRTDREGARSSEEALAELRLTMTSDDPVRAGRRFSSAVVEMAVASVPGFSLSTPPREATASVSLWTALLSSTELSHLVTIDGETTSVPAAITGEVSPIELEPFDAVSIDGPFVTAPLGRLYGARSGDKGGTATLGVWAKTPEAYAHLAAMLSTDRLRQLLPDCAGLSIGRFELPNLLAVHFCLYGFLEGGVAASTKRDPQAKALGEVLRARLVSLPARLL